MTELYIDGQQVVLPYGFETTITAENAFLTRSGEYSFDLDIDLENEINSKIYKHLNRANNLQKISSRKAILISNNKIIINGIESVIEIAEKSVKIQLLSGNSELNYIGADKKIWDFDLGIIPEISNSAALNSLSQMWPQSNYVCTPINVSGNMMNEFDYQSKSYNPFNWSNPQVTNICPQPYLAFIFEQIINAIGYKITDNDYENDARYRRLFLTNPLKNGNWADCLPDWTVNQFLSEYENFWGAVLVIDSISNTVKLKKNTNVNLSKQAISLEKVIDEHTVEIDGENQVNKLSYNWVSYDFPSDLFYKFLKLDKDLLKAFPVEVHSTYSSMRWLMYGPENYWLTSYFDKRITYVSGTDKYYILKQYPYKIWNHPEYFERHSTFLSHQFRNIGPNENGNVISLKIVPSKMSFLDFEIEFYTTPIQGNYWAYEFPSIDDITIADKDGVLATLENGVKFNSRPSHMFVCIYRGMNYIRQRDNGQIIFTNGVPGDHTNTPKWPQSQIDLYLSFCDDQYECPKLIESEDDNYLTLSTCEPNGMYNSYYKNAISVDYTQKFIFDFVEQLNLDAWAIFIIKNRRFICEKLEYTIDNTGVGKTVKGYFYPVVEVSAAKTRSNLLSSGAFIDSDKFTDTMHWNDTSTLPTVVNDAEEPFASTIARDPLLHNGQYIDPDKFTDDQPWTDVPVI